jgi:hypothetical protein
VCSALIDGRPDKVTGARSWTNGSILYIHENPHAKRNDDGSYTVSFQGFRTKLTLSRLNGLFALLHGTQPFFLKQNGAAYFMSEDREVGAFEWFLIPKAREEGFPLSRK